MNGTLFRSKRHDNYVMPISPITCSYVTTLPESVRCQFVKTNVCRYFFIPYSQLYYCNFNTDNNFNSVIGIAVLCIICGYYFWLLAMISKSYLCPAMKTLAKLLHFSEYVAGVTIVAYANAAPDLFTTLASYDWPSRNPYSDAYAASLFVCIFVAGAVIVSNPFSIEPWFFLREVTFTLLDVVYMDFCVKINKQEITREMACGLPCIYLVYMIVIFTDHSLIMRERRMLERVEDTGVTQRDKGRYKSIPVIKITKKRNMWREQYDTANLKLWQQFWKSIKPFSLQKFKQSNHFDKILAILKLPLTLLMRLVIPYVDHEKDNYGWSKLLCCFQFALTPFVIALGIFKFQTFFGIPIILIVFLCTSPLAVMAFALTRTDTTPPYYKYMSIFSSVATTFIIYGVAAEVIVLLEVLGITMHRSDALIGVTLLAWGNSVGDLIANISLSKEGFPRMAYAACFGAPVLNSMCSIGINMMYKTFSSESGTAILREGTMGESASVFLIIGLIITLLYGTTTNFMLRRCCGIVNIVVYCIFLLYVVLSEAEIIHALGTDHILDLT